jgi:hypothetical protein
MDGDPLSVVNCYNFICTNGNESGNKECSFGSFQQNNMHDFHDALA